MNWTSHSRAVKPKKAPLSSFLLCFIDFIIVLSPGQGPFSLTAQLGGLPGAGPGNTEERQAKYGWINLQSYSSPPATPHPCFKAAVPSGNSDRPLRIAAGDYGWQGSGLVRPKAGSQNSETDPVRRSRRVQ